MKYKSKLVLLSSLTVLSLSLGNAAQAHYDNDDNKGNSYKSSSNNYGWYDRDRDDDRDWNHKWDHDWDKDWDRNSNHNWDRDWKDDWSQYWSRSWKKDWDNGKNGNNKVYICHGTGSSSNPYVLVQVSSNSTKQGHYGHGDPVEFNHLGNGKCAPKTNRTTTPVATLAVDSGSSNSDRYTNGEQVNVSGILSGATWYYSLNNGSTWTKGSGTSFNVPSPDGIKNVLVKQTYCGKTSPNSTVLTFTLDNVVAPPTLALAQDTGTPGDKITTNGTINVGALEANGKWEYSIDNGAFVAGSGNSFTVTALGEHTVRARQTDLAGNVSATTSLTFRLASASIPAPPVAALALDSGSSNSDRITNGEQVNVTGILPGATWQYSLDNITWTNGTSTNFNVPAPDGTKNVYLRQTSGGVQSLTSPVFSFTLDNVVAAPDLKLAFDTGSSSTDRITSNGTVSVGLIESGATWEYSLNGTSWSNGTGNNFVVTANGSYTVHVRQPDGAGNSSTSTLSFTLTVAVPAPAPKLAVDSGSSNSDRITNGEQVNITGLVTGAGTSWQYSLDGGATWSASISTSITSFDVPASDGVKNVIARQTDAAGNLSPSSAVLTFTLDNEAVAPDLDVMIDGGAEEGDGVISATVSVDLIEPGASWQYSVNGGGWTNGIGGSFTVSGEGGYTVLVRQTDVAGNLSPESSETFTLDDGDPPLDPIEIEVCAFSSLLGGAELEWSVIYQPETGKFTGTGLGGLLTGTISGEDGPGGSLAQDDLTIKLKIGILEAESPEGSGSLFTGISTDFELELLGGSFSMIYFMPEEFCSGAGS